MSKEYLFMIGEGTEKLLLVCTRDRLIKTRDMIISVLDEWEEHHDFGYMAFTGQLTYKRSGEFVDGSTEEDEEKKEA